MRDAAIGLTLFELTENVRVRRTGPDRYVRISDLAPVRRYAPQLPGEEDLKRDMPTGRCVIRAYSPVHDTEWQHEWVEKQAGEFVGMAKAIADLLEEAVPILVQQAWDADERERVRQGHYRGELRRQKALEQARARRQARQVAIDELKSIVRAWNDAFAFEALFAELSRRAAAAGEDERLELEKRIGVARDLVGGQDAISRFLKWTMPGDGKHEDSEEELDRDYGGGDI